MGAVSSPGPSVWEAGVSLGEEGDVTTEAELAETGRGCAAHRAEGEGAAVPGRRCLQRLGPPRPPGGSGPVATPMSAQREGGPAPTSGPGRRKPVLFKASNLW